MKSISFALSAFLGLAGVSGCSRNAIPPTALSPKTEALSVRSLPAPTVVRGVLPDENAEPLSPQDRQSNLDEHRQRMERSLGKTLPRVIVGALNPSAPRAVSHFGEQSQTDLTLPVVVKGR